MKNGNYYTRVSSINSGSSKNKEAMFSFYLIVVYLFLEYGRPQLLLPFLRDLHLPAITVIFMAISLLLSGKASIKDKQTVFYLMLLAEMVIHGPIAVNNYWAFQIFYSMVVTFIAYLVIVNMVDSLYKYEKLIKYWLLIYIFLAIYGYFNANLHLPKYLRSGMGVGGFLGDQNDFCMALNMILPFSLFGIFSERKKSDKIYYILLTCLFTFVIFLTESRGGFVGLISVAFYCWLKSNKKIILLILFGLLALFALVVAPSSYWDEVKTISTENTEVNPTGTGAQRVYAWKIGWRIFLNNPVIGVGQGNYPWNVGETEKEMGVLWQTRSLSGRAAHSLYFTILPELGAVGTIIFALFIIYSLKNLKFIRNSSMHKKNIFPDDESRRIYYASLALEGSLIGFMTSSIFISTLYYPSIWILCAFIVALNKIVQNRAIA